MNVRNEKYPQEMKCNWMLAGVINYRLCDRNFECETCEFDRVMRGLLPRDTENSLLQKDMDTALTHSFLAKDDWVTNLANQYLLSIVKDCQIFLNRCYLPSHFWSSGVNANMAQLGIDRLLMKVMAPVEEVILPKEGQRYQPGQLIAWIVRGEKTWPLYAPTAGTVCEINPEIDSNAWDELLKNDFWLFRMQAPQIRKKLQQQCDSMRSLHNYSQKLKIIKNVLIESLQENLPEDVSVTLADGGKIETDLAKVLGEKKFQALIERLFSKKM